MPETSNVSFPAERVERTVCLCAGVERFDVGRDGGGATAFTVMDHWFQMEARAPATDPMLEGYTTLGFLAGQTERMRLGLLVTLQICRQMWSDDDGPYEGRHDQLAETICSPPPISRPPILVGGSGERKTLRLVARYADACNLFARSPAEVAHKLAVLDQHCAAVDRDPDTIDRTILAIGNPLDDPQRFVSTMADHANLGISAVDVMPVGDPVAFTTEVMEHIVPALADLGP